jgi:hypothetical protein
MKKPTLKTVSKLTDLPNIGNAMAEDLRLIGIGKPDDLTGRNPIVLYEMLCRKTGKRHDPCVIDAFMSIVHFMEAGESLPWWRFTEKRKKIFNKAASVAIARGEEKKQTII